MSASDFRPSASWDVLRLRARMLRTIREFFDARRFLEVETPTLSADVVVDRHLEPLETVVLGRRMFLQTSPEFAMKRLMAATDEPDAPSAIYQITRAFRADERGSRHNPEFTIVEWYRRDDGLADGMQLLSDFAVATLGCGPAERMSYREAFARYVGVDPLCDPIAILEAKGRMTGLAPPKSFDRGDRDAWLDWLLVELVEPHLGIAAPTILYDYPPSQAALARVRHDSPPVAERFELYVAGVELANGYHELLDANVLRERNRANNALRQSDGKRELPADSRLLAAMDAGLPACTGVALGFDRLVMLAAGATEIRDVIAFPFEQA